MKRFGMAVATGVLVLSGCGSGGGVSSTTTVTETVTETAESSSSATTAGSERDEVKFGQSIEGDLVKFTVSDVRDVTDGQDEFDSGTWAAMIEICATGDLGGPISPMSHFVLLDDSGGTYQPNGMSGGNMPTPQLDPGSVSVPQGKCRKGNLFFSAPSDAKITGAEATDSSGASMGAWSS